MKALLLLFFTFYLYAKDPVEDNFVRIGVTQHLIHKHQDTCHELKALKKAHKTDFKAEYGKSVESLQQNTAKTEKLMVENRQFLKSIKEHPLLPSHMKLHERSEKDFIKLLACLESLKEGELTPYGKGKGSHPPGTGGEVPSPDEKSKWR